MKRFFLLFLVLLLVLGLVACSDTENKKAADVKENREQTVGTFELAQYQEEIDGYLTYREGGFNLPTGLNVGEVTDAETAAEKAKELWRDVLHVNKDMEEMQVYVAYDAQEECWYMRNIKPAKPETLGGVYHTIIQANGDVLAIWFEE